MKKIFFLFVFSLLISTSAMASHWVHGYYRKTGTYVAGHMSDNPGEGIYGHWHDNRYYSN